jgi:hypothetical protein
MIVLTLEIMVKNLGYSPFCLSLDNFSNTFLEVLVMNDWKEAIHPGEILADELDFLGLSVEHLAKYIKV